MRRVFQVWSAVAYIKQIEKAREHQAAGELRKDVEEFELLGTNQLSERILAVLECVEDIEIRCAFDKDKRSKERKRQRKQRLYTTGFDVCSEALSFNDFEAVELRKSIEAIHESVMRLEHDVKEFSAYCPSRFVS
jgi:hypothetical protein